MKIDKKLIKELVDHLSEFNLTELEYQEGQTKIKVSKASKGLEKIQSSSVVSANKAVLNKTDDSDGVRVKSPIIGTAYLAPEPGGKKFVEVGDKIKKGQTVMIVEAMKTMNHVPSSADGVVKKIKKGDTVMIVEAMKTMNHVPSTSDGVVKEICVDDGQPVEFGQTIIILE